MKTAIVLVGAMRSFDRCLPTQAWHVYRHFPDADFFVSTIADEDAGKADLLKARFPKASVKVDVVESQPDCVAEMRAAGVSLPDEWIRGRPYTFEPYAISVHPQAVLRQLWQLCRAWGNFDLSGYDVIVRMRPDLYFHSFDLVLPGDEAAASVPWWGRFGGVNDRFAVLGQAAALAYFGTYGRIPQLTTAGCPLHPESLVKASLLDAGCDIYETLQADFSTLRTNGEMRPPEIQTSDLTALMAR